MNALAILLATALAVNQAGDTAAPIDPRIQVVAYDPDQVVTLPVGLGYAAVIELGPDERVDSVVVGDSATWQVTANKRGDRVVVKPLSNATQTNMVVITGDRRYVFLLQSIGGGLSPFVLRFVYTQVTISSEPTTTAAAVATFRFRGAKQLFPVAMRDDGKRTAVSWGKDTPLPAIFAVDEGNRETIVNGRMVGGDYVIEGTAPRYVLRLGRARAVAVRRMIEQRK